MGRADEIKATEINGNRYIVILYLGKNHNEVEMGGNDRDRKRPVCLVYYDSKGSFIVDDNTWDYMVASGGRRKVAKKKWGIYETPDPSKMVSQTLNKAVCEVEKKEERQEDLELKVDAALEANKEIHEDELDKLLES